MAAALIAIALVPATEALRGGLDAADVAHGERVRADRLRDRLETTLAAPYGTLAAAAAGPSTPSTLSDPAGSTDRILVYLAPYDGDDADGDGDAMTGGDDGLLWVRVTIDGTALAFETVTAR